MENTSERAISDSPVDFDLIMDELLSGDYMSETPNYSDLFNQSTSASNRPFGCAPFSPLLEFDDQEFAERPDQDSNISWLIQPRYPIVPLNDRLFHALRFIKESQRDRDVLAQIWVPIRIGGSQLLTTCGQPFWLDTVSQSLANYRAVSMNYQFSAEENSNESVGLPGRVFLGKVPEWTPDVRYFRSDEYPRVDEAQRYNICGSIALPIFERDSRSCIGVVEVVSTTQKINYSSDLESICSALQAVDLRSSDALSVPRTKVRNKSYQVALPEIRQMLKSVCEAHSLPLAQTWITCTEQGKRGSRHSDENYKECISTIDDACYVNDLTMLGFHEACSEHHLCRGQGVVGKAFTTNQPCFSPNVTSLTKTEYPLSHHAKLFQLRGAVAIRLRSIYTGKADFVLELFLPINCIESENQKTMLNSLSITIQMVCQSLRVVDANEIEDKSILEIDGAYPSDHLFDESTSEGNVILERFPSGGISRQVEAGNINACPSSVPLEFSKEIEEFGIATEWDASSKSKVELTKERIFSEFKWQQKCSKDKNDTSSGDGSLPRNGKASEKRCEKLEKTVTLQVLRKYFAGSLKDAAKSIGVCPTTLKRICRQHGITRWPSRKIKKVGHSLKKLQAVLDSVQGAEGTFRFSSVYESFRKTSNGEENLPGNCVISTRKQTEHTKSSNPTQRQECRFSSNTSLPNSLSSPSFSQSSTLSFGCSSGSKQSTRAPLLVVEQEATKLERETSQIDLQLLSQQPPSHTAFGEQSSLENQSQSKMKRSGGFKVKAFCGEEKVRFTFQPTWSFHELKKQMMNRFNISDACSVNLKYLDDDAEWVLLTCDEDLQECIDVYKSSNADTIKISVL